MQRSSRRRPRFAPGLAGILLVAGAGSVQAEEVVPTVDEMQRQLDAQTQQIDRLQRELDRQRAALAELRRSMSLAARGRGNAPSANAGAETANTEAGQVTTQHAAPPAPVQSANRVGMLAQAEAEPEPQPETEPTEPVGQAPAAPDRPPEVAPLFEAPGVLTAPGQWIIEPSLQYAYSSSDRISLVGYTVIPAILVGLIDVRNVKANAFTATLSFRRGLTNRFEMEARLPYVYRYDDVRSREIFEGTASEEFFNHDADGSGIGDVELIGRYQLNDGGGDSPYYIASLRFKTRTGKDPFESRTRLGIEGARVSGVQEELPTGSGFYSLTPGLTVLVPSDPAVFFGGISYQYSFKRTNVESNVVPESDLIDYDEIQPGGVFGFNFGMGLALNERSSFSIGYDHLSVDETDARFENGGKPDGVRIQLGSLLLGYSYKLNDKRTLNLSLGVGVTRDTPDLQLTLRMPITM